MRDMTASEIAAWYDQKRCPFCGAKAQYQKGPCGGMMMNVRLPCCGAELNVCNPESSVQISVGQVLFEGHVLPHTNDVHPDSEYQPTFSLRCLLGRHRLYETVGNYAIGSPSTGLACFRCRRKWDWQGRPRPINHQGD